MSKSISETLREQGVVLTEAPNFEQPMETAEKTKVELAMEMTNTNISKKCRKAFNKFVKKYELEIDFEKYEGKTDELMELINKTVTDDEEVSLVRHMKSYCKSVLKNLSKMPDVVGINGAFCSKEEADKVSPTAVTNKTTRYIEKEPKMTEYRRAGKVNQYFDDLKIWQQQYTA